MKLNASDALIKTLINNGLEVVFANPGTSEMHLVAAIDHNPKVRPVLGLFEGVVSGAADGYARMSGKAAANLLHLGPGLGNAFANIHNARKANSPMINIVGDHASYHLKHNAPLTSDLDGLSNVSSDWVGRLDNPRNISKLANTAWQTANSPSGKVATMIIPADYAWSDIDIDIEQNASINDPKSVDYNDISKAYDLLKKDKSMLFIGGRFLNEDCLKLASHIASATNCRLVTDTFVPKIRRGAGLPIIEQVPYFAEMAELFLADTQSIVFIGSRPPVSFFAYPDKKSFLSPDSAELFELCSNDDDGISALNELKDLSGSIKIDEKLIQSYIGDVPTSGDLDATTLGPLLAGLMPEDSIVSDEATTSSLLVSPFALQAKPHDWLALCGGSIGQGLPLAVGASLAKPDRPVITLHGDGGAMYTLQALWTQARENLNITNIIFSNRSYEILKIELDRVQAIETGDRAASMFSLDNPPINWCKLSESMGVPAYNPKTVKEFTDFFNKSINEPGPSLIELNV